MGRLGRPDLGQSRPQAVQRLITRHHREHAGAYPRSRALGRLELLFGRAELLDEYPARLAEVGPEHVAAAARRLCTAPKGVLVMAPGPTRTRPAPAPGPDSLPEPESAPEPNSVPDPGSVPEPASAPGVESGPQTVSGPESMAASPTSAAPSWTSSCSAVRARSLR
ncbi:hypothetical protein [Streptomyces sp. NPDC004296]|uniref:hypothetical protein n=1 Tax=Streptomyces sp. NPDC004296 TaxID=3364697 RepID=UPI003676755E